MKNLFWRFFVSLYEDVPPVVYEGLLSILFFGIVAIGVIIGFRKGLRKIVGLILVEYVTLLYCSMVVFRVCSDEAGYDFCPFWSYLAIQEGRIELIPENVMNVVVFIPVGLLFASFFHSTKWWTIFLAGGVISISIEAMQYFFHRGFAETDDVIHNTLGCLIGYGLYLLGKKGLEKYPKRSVAVM